MYKNEHHVISKLFESLIENMVHVISAQFTGV